MKLGIDIVPWCLLYCQRFLINAVVWNVVPLGLANGIASWFINDVRLFGFLYLSSVFLWSYVAVIVSALVRGPSSARWLVGGSLSLLTAHP